MLCVLKIKDSISYFTEYFIYLFFCLYNNTSSNNISINIICSAISNRNSINCSTTSNNICRTISIASKFPAMSLPAPRSDISKGFLPVVSIWGR
ncbi:uncharacterized protein LOC124807204 isoform X6 [Hydra vulgaris]|uniref:uncharacterized protein LOC124807204 isoform X6 n=1 Tax=Hydra vulgaris TaxID=6087 RepID=UPI0032EA033B